MKKNIKIKIILILMICILAIFAISAYTIYAKENNVISMSRVIKDGVYYISFAKDTNYLLEIEGGSLSDGGKLSIGTKTRGTYQKFYISYSGNGYYNIESIASTKRLEVKDSSSESGAEIQQNSESNNSNQRWKIRKNIDGTYNFIAECSGKAIDVANADVAEDKVQQYDYTNSYAQRFKIEGTEIFDTDVNDGVVFIRSRGDPSKQLDLTDNSPEEGAKLHLWTEASTLAQRFQLQRVGENEVRIRTASSGGWLKEKSKKEGTDIIQVGDSGTLKSNSDTWKVEYDKGIVFVNKESGLVLSIDGEYADDAKVTVKPKEDTDSQRFIVRPIDLIPSGYYKLQNPYGTLMDITNGGTTAGTNIQTWTASEGINQTFKITKHSAGYKIEAPLSGLVVEVANGSKDNAANVQLGNDSGETSQRWQATICDGGYLAFKNVNSGLMLNVHEFNSNAGANVNQGENDNSEAQRWRLIITTEPRLGYYKIGSDYYYFDASGNRTLFARNLGEWDFTDWDFVSRMKQIATTYSSDTYWFIAVDWNAPCREVVFYWIDGDWVAVAGWYCGVGQIVTTTGKPRGVGGAHTITAKWEKSDTGPGYCMDYIGVYEGGTPSATGNNSASFHAGMVRGQWGYTTHSCIANTPERAKWLYDNIPLGTRMYNNGDLHGYENAGDENLAGEQKYDIQIQDPFS